MKVDKLRFPSEWGFSRFELVVVIGCLMATFSMLFVSAGLVHGGNGAVRCLENLRRMTLAWALYADENDGALLRSGDRGNAHNVPDWAYGKQPFPVAGSSLGIGSSTDIGTVDPEALLSRSPLLPYLGAAWGRAQALETFHCPGDRSKGTTDGYRGERKVPVVRSYAMNNWIGGNDAGFGQGRTFSRRSDISRPVPSSLLVFLGERADSINDTAFMIGMAGYHPSRPNPESYRVVDFPANYHSGGACVSYADGHVELKVWTDRRTTPVFDPRFSLRLNLLSPSNPDVAWLQVRASSLPF